MAQQFDTSVPNIARVYDFWLGGKDNFAADRELAAQLTALYPPIAQMIWDNRQFLARAVGWVARQGIKQFIDLGPGLPTSPSTHEAARAVTSGTTVAYVDFDPLVVSHLDALVANGQDGIVVVAADLRDRDGVLSAPDLVGHIDLSQPACLVMGAVLHFLDAVAAAELAASYARLLTPGSYVIITVGRGDGEVADRFFSMYRAAAKMHSHSLDQFATFFEGLEIVPPGLVLAEQWQPDLQHVRPVPKRPGEVLVGVGKVPGRPLHGVLCGGRSGSRRGDAGEDHGYVVFESFGECADEPVAGGIELAGFAGQDGTQGEDSLAKGAGAGFYESVGVQGDDGAGRELDARLPVDRRAEPE